MNDDVPSADPGATTNQSLRSVGIPFFITVFCVFTVFLGYEVLERAWLIEAYPGLIDTFHILRGIGTSLIVAVFLAWFFLRTSPHRMARRVLVTSLLTEDERERRTRARLTSWFTRFRWVVVAVFLLGMLIIATLNRDHLWSHNYYSLMVLGALMTAANGFYHLLDRANFGFEHQLPYQMVLDFFFITFFLHYTGGLENPAYMLYFIHIILATILFSLSGALTFGGFAFALLSLLGISELTGIIPHYDFVLFHPGEVDFYNNSQYVAGVLVLFGGVVVVSTYLTSIVVEALREYRDRLREEKERSESLVEKLFEVREEERARVSRELHDQIGQSLSALRLKLDQVESENGDPDEFHDIKESVEDAVDEVRGLSHQLRPPMLDDCGLACAIEDYAEEIQANHDVNVDFEHLGVEHSRNFTISVDTALYRVAQESVMNAVEHGSPRNISVILQFSKGVIQLMVEDDGSGFDERILDQNNRETLGIQGMKERVQLLDGIFTLESATGDGTRVRVEVPIGESAESDGNPTDDIDDYEKQLEVEVGDK